MFCITLKHHFCEPEVEVMYRLLCYVYRCGHRGNSLRPQCRYDTIRYNPEQSYGVFEILCRQSEGRKQVQFVGVFSYIVEKLASSFAFFTGALYNKTESECHIAKKMVWFRLILLLYTRYFIIAQSGLLLHAGVISGVFVLLAQALATNGKDSLAKVILAHINLTKCFYAQKLHYQRETHKNTEEALFSV